MAFKSILVFILTTKLCTIDNVLGVHINERFLNDYDIGGQYKLSPVPRFKRDLNDIEYFNKGELVGFVPEYLSVFDKLIPEMKNKMEVVKGNLFFPRSSENYSSQDLPPSFIKSEQPNSNQDGYVNENEKDTYQGLNVRPETVFTEDPMSLEIETPDSYLVQATGNQIDWKKGVEDEVALNANSDMYNNFNEEVFNVNQLETGTDSPKDGVIGCYNHCLQNCYGTSSTPPRSHLESGRQARPLIININSECLTHPSQRFPHRYGFKPKLNMNALKFHGLPRKIHRYSSCPFSEIPQFYY